MIILKCETLGKKLISLVILLLTLGAHLVSYWSYILAVSLVINDPSDFIYFLCLKLNFPQIAKINKNLKLRTLTKMAEKDVYNRFSLLTCVIYVVAQNLFDHKINAHNFVFYFCRVAFLLGSEVLFDWVKQIFFFKISGIHSKYLKLLSFELSVLHEKIRISRSPSTSYGKYIKGLKLQLISQTNAEKFKSVIDRDALLSIELKHSNLVHTILVAAFLVENIGMSLISVKTVLILVIILLYIKIFRLYVKSFILDNAPSISRKSFSAKGRVELIAN